MASSILWAPQYPLAVPPVTSHVNGHLFPQVAQVASVARTAEELVTAHGPFAGARISGGTFHFHVNNNSDNTAAFNVDHLDYHLKRCRIRGPIINSDSD